MPSYKPFEITLGDINYLLDQMRAAIVILRYDGNGRAVFGYYNSIGGVVEMGLFGTFDPLTIVDPTTGLSIYDGAREASGFRLSVGFFNNLVDLTRWSWGGTDEPFPRLTVADYSNYVQQVTNNPALINYTASHPTFVPVADNSANYQNLNTTVVDYTPRMITQTISSSYTDHAVGVADSALTRTGVETDALTSDVVVGFDVNGAPIVQSVTEHMVRNLNTLPVIHPPAGYSRCSASSSIMVSILSARAARARKSSYRFPRMIRCMVYPDPMAIRQQRSPFRAPHPMASPRPTSMGAQFPSRALTA